MEKDKIIKLIICSIGLLFLVNIGLSYKIFFKDKSKTAYVLSAGLYDKYKGKVEIEKSLTQSQNLNKTFFDSLQLELQYIQKSVDAGKTDKSILDAKYKAYGNMYQEYQSQNESDVQKLNAQIWNQINQYVKDYGKEKGYTYIYGTNGEGTLMYAEEDKNITDDVLKYINGKYDGK